MNVFTAFSGYDSQLMALRDIGADYECVGWSEIDKWAIKAHNAVFPELVGRNYGDITRIDWNAVPDFDLFTYSFPCTDISNAGEQRGFDEGSGTRSSLLWECRKPIISKRPKYLLMENVKALVSKKYRPLFLKWDKWLRALGYVNHPAVLNAKDFGVPQNRERVFMLSILNGSLYEFPHPVRLEKRLKDILEPEVDEKYYLSEKAVKSIKNGAEIAATDRVMQIGATKETDWNRQQYRVYDPNGICPTITTKSGGGLEPKLLFKGAELNEGDGFYYKVSTKFNRGGLAGMSRTLKAETHDACVVHRGRVRRLTPRECLRLMGVSESDIELMIAEGISNTQLYKLAGNSIVKPILMGIFRNMLNIR